MAFACIAVCTLAPRRSAYQRSGFWQFVLLDGNRGRYRYGIDQRNSLADTSGRLSDDQFWQPYSEQRATLDRKSTRLNSSHLGISYAVFCLKKKNNSSGQSLATAFTHE